VQKSSSGNDSRGVIVSSLDPTPYSASTRIRSRTGYDSTRRHDDLSFFAYDGPAEKRAAALASIRKSLTQALGPVAAMYLLEPYENADMRYIKRLQEAMEQDKKQRSTDTKAEIEKLEVELRVVRAKS
jgi:hypothetical protein